MEYTKPWYFSKTLIFNALTALIVLATYFGYTPDQAFASDLSHRLLMASPVINFLLRLITKKPVTFS